MKVLEKVSDFLGKFMAAVVLVIAALALFMPASSTWIQTGWVNYLLMIVMFGMGLTLKLEDFKLVFTRPKDILVGCVAQFTVMPFLAFLLGKIFGLDAALLAGVILVGTCPGGTSSNVITFMSKCGAFRRDDQRKHDFGADPDSGHHLSAVTDNGYR